MRTSCALLLVSLLAACGDDVTEPPDNEAPLAQITTNRTSVPAGDNFQTLVTLDASGSSDPEGTSLTFAWVVPSGRFENGTSDDDPVIEVTFPGAAPYTVTVTVTDADGAQSQVSVTIGIS